MVRPPPKVHISSFFIFSSFSLFLFFLSVPPLCLCHPVLSLSPLSSVTLSSVTLSSLYMVSIYGLYIWASQPTSQPARQPASQEKEPIHRAHTYSPYIEPIYTAGRLAGLLFFFFFFLNKEKLQNKTIKNKEKWERPSAKQMTEEDRPKPEVRKAGKNEKSRRGGRR